MEHLEYEVKISAPARVVWETMLQKETYKQWVAKSWPNSTYVGKWEKGEEIKFVGEDGTGGTLAKLEEVKPYESVLAKHIGIITEDGSIDRTSDLAKGWIGITEEYRFKESKGETTVKVVIESRGEWTKMFDDGWPTALQELKKLSEKQLAEA
jgi:uncharacterized protein YndB with AHSA1/START domain